jgi:glycosidase
MSQNMLNFLENHDEQRYASEQYANDAMTVLPSLVVSATINTGAMMIYMGQELGEKATDAEGYSGKDGRTTIFDYWSLPTLRQWLNNGNCDLRRLSREERKLRTNYAKVLNLVNDSSAIREGKFFDLMYVNNQNAFFNSHKQYAYLRAANDELLLIVVNFDNIATDVKVNIPSHAFEYLGIAQGVYDTIDLLSEQQQKIALNDTNPVSVKIESYGALIVRFNLSNLHKN